MRELLIAIIVLLLNYSIIVQSEPQLDLPPITPPTAPRNIQPTLQFNSYPDRDDRSTRFGPPYDDISELRANKSRNNVGSGRESYSGSYYNEDCRPTCNNNRYDGNYRTGDRNNDDEYYRQRDRDSYQKQEIDYQNNRDRDYNNNNRDRDYNRDPYNQYNRDQQNRNRYPDDRNPQYHYNNRDYYNRSRYDDTPYSYNDRYNPPNHGYDDPRNDPQY